MKNQKGSAVVWIMVILVAIIAAGAAYWHWTQGANQPATATTSILPAKQPSAAQVAPTAAGSAGTTNPSAWLSTFPKATFDHPLTYYQIPETYGGKTITLFAWLATPSGQGPFPVVILAHGCNGFFGTNANGTYIGAWPQYEFWADWLVSKGYGVLFLDSYTGRGINNICNGGAVNNSGQAIPLEQFDALRAVDFYTAADYLTKLSVVDPRAIGLLGDSNGGGSILDAASEGNSDTAQTRAALAADGGQIAAFATLYPGCQADVIHALFFAPVLILAGSADDWAPPAPCEALASYPRTSGGTVTIKVYPGATHSFDIQGSTTPHVNSLGYTIAYDPSATADAQTQIANFFAQYLQ